MALEQLANSAQSALNGTINSAVTSLVVNSASAFSTAPQFRIIVDSELMLVTAVAGATFTVTRGIEGTAAASHNNGATVTQILTKAGMAQYRTDLLGIINVKTDYGAVGDGVADDTTAIANAITAAEGATYDTNIIFPPGIYLTDTLQVIAGGGSVTMTGIGLAVLRKKPGSTPSIMRINSNFNRIVNFQLDGNNIVSGNSGIEIRGNFNIVEQCIIYNCTGHGILITNAGGGGSDNIIRDNYIFNNGMVGVATTGAVQNIIYGNKMLTNGAEGITLDTASYRNRVIGNYVAGNCTTSGAGNISIDAGDISVISGNEVHAAATSQGGIVFNNQAAGTQSCIISNNMVFDNGGKGIWLKAGAGGNTSFCVVTGNILRGNGSTAILIDAGCNSNVVVANCANGGTITNNGASNQVANNT